MKKSYLSIILLLASTGCSPDSEPAEATFAPQLLGFDIDIDKDDEPGKAILGAMSVALMSDSADPADVGETATIKISSSSNQVFEWLCTTIYDTTNATEVSLQCPEPTNADAIVLCDETVSAIAALKLNGTDYVTDPAVVTVLCMGSELRLDLVERPVGNNPPGFYCSEVIVDDDSEEKFGYEDGRVNVVKTYEEGQLTEVVAYDYNSDGTVSTVTSVKPDGVVSNLVTYDYQDGVVSKETYSSKATGVTESCVYNHISSEKLTETCTDGVTHVEWDPVAKTIEIDGEERDATVSYSGELSSLTAFLTLHPAQYANSLKPLQISTQGTLAVYSYKDGLMDSFEVSLAALGTLTYNYAYDCD